MSITPRLSRRGVLAAGATSTAALGLAACGSSGSSGGSSGSDAAGAQGMFDERGPITFAKGKDTSGKLAELIERWNKDHADEKVTLIELPESADEQRAQMINNAQAKSDAFTVLGVDVVWTAEFAAQQWIVELPEDKFPLDEMMPATIETGRYFKNLYAVPWNTNAEMLFYRKDWLEAAGAEDAPQSFEEMYEIIDLMRKTPDAKDTLGFASQYAKYEGLTVQLTGLAKSAGGALFDDQGTPTANSEQVQAGLQAVRDGFDQGYIPKEALTYMEEEGRQAFQDGRLAFLQNWPYVWELAQKEDGSSTVAGKIGAAPLPGIGGKEGASALGGLNLGISAFGKNQGTAVDFINFMVSEAQQKEWAMATGQAPTTTAVYEDQEVLDKFPFFTMMKKAIDNGTPRPQAVKYGEVTQAIQEAGYAVLSGAKETTAALDELQTTLEGLSS